MAALKVLLPLAALVLLAAPSATDKCPVCGMFVAKYPNWAVTVKFKDSSSVYLDGPKDTFGYLLNVKKYTPGKDPSKVTDVTVKDYYTLKAIDGRDAFYVTGSDVYGPMGRELVPLEKAEDAREFARDHDGKRILKFGEVTPEVLKKVEY